MDCAGELEHLAAQLIQGLRAGVLDVVDGWGWVRTGLGRRKHLEHGSP